MSAIRDLSRERRWLERAELVAGRSGFVEHAIGRLASGAMAYGDRWAELGVDELLIELAEEAADLGGWGVLAVQALDLDPALVTSTRAPLVAHLERVICLGARAHRELVRARLELTRAARPTARAFIPDVDGRCLSCGRGYSAHPRNLCSPRVDELDTTGPHEPC